MYRHLYSQFIESNKDIQHYCAHSHHFWPDITKDAVLEHWQDSCELTDKKWGKIFGQKVPKAQSLICEILGLKHHEQITFAPNVHELTYRILSSFYSKSSKTKILTTDSEFYSFSRQMRRWKEENIFDFQVVESTPFESFEQRFLDNYKQYRPDIVFLSHVFFNSGVACDIELLLNEIPKEVPVIVDGYHGFMAMATTFTKFEDRLFYMSGSYKYAQGGEGASFLYSPKGCELRPLNTGWFAEFSDLSHVKSGEVGFSNDGARFSGSTMDFTGVYRLIATLEVLKSEGLTIEKIHEYVKAQQKAFLKELKSHDNPYLNEKNLLLRDQALNDLHGNFLTFKMVSPEQTEALAKALETEKIMTDYREDRIRFGLGLYHSGNFDLSALKEIRI